jgi:hypothetical protein
MDACCPPIISWWCGIIAPPPCRLASPACTRDGKTAISCEHHGNVSARRKCTRTIGTLTPAPRRLWPPPLPPPPLPRQALAARLRGFNGTELGHLAELGAALQAAAATEAADRAAMERRIDAEVAGLDYSLGNATLKQREQLTAKVWCRGSACTHTRK